MFFIVSFSQLFADIVYLKNGKKIEGKIVNQSRTQIQIDVNGKLELIDKQNINKIEFENLEERKKQEELKRKQEIKPPNTEFVYLKTVVLPGWGEYSINNYYRSAIWGGLF